MGSLGPHATPSLLGCQLLGEGTQRIVWERPLGTFWKILFPTGPGQPWLDQHQWAKGRAKTGRQQSVTQEQGPRRAAWPGHPTAPGSDQGGPRH